MKPTLIVLVAALAGACGGGGGSGTSTAMKNLANFEGAGPGFPLFFSEARADRQGDSARVQGRRPSLRLTSIGLADRGTLPKMFRTRHLVQRLNWIPVRSNGVYGRTYPASVTQVPGF